MTHLQINDADLWTLVNALTCAGEKYDENARTMGSIVRAGGTPLVTEQAARWLERQFSVQAADVRSIRDAIQMASED